MDLWEENRWIWNAFWHHFAPLMLQRRWEPQGPKRWTLRYDIDADTLRWLMDLYPIEPPRQMLAKIRAITAEYWGI